MRPAREGGRPATGGRIRLFAAIATVPRPQFTARCRRRSRGRRTRRGGKGWPRGPWATHSPRSRMTRDVFSPSPPPGGTAWRAPEGADRNVLCTAGSGDSDGFVRYERDQNKAGAGTGSSGGGPPKGARCQRGGGGAYGGASRTELRSGGCTASVCATVRGSLTVPDT